MTATALARSKARARYKALAKCNAKYWIVSDAKHGDNFQSPEMRDYDRESRRFFFFQDQVCGSFRNSAHESWIKVANHVRGGVSKFTFAVDSDSVRANTAWVSVP